MRRMTRSSARTPFQTDHADLSTDMQDKSADHGLEVKDLDTDAEAADPLSDPVTEPAGEGSVPDAPEADAETIETVTVEMIHHYQDYVPGQPVVLDEATADNWCSALIAKRV